MGSENRLVFTSVPVNYSVLADAPEFLEHQQMHVHPEPGWNAKLEIDRLLAVVRTRLSDRHADVVVMRMHGWLLTDIMQVYGVSQARITQLYTRALEVMREETHKSTTQPC